MKPKCTCQAIAEEQDDDMDEGEHYITCPTVLTGEVLDIIGL